MTACFTQVRDNNYTPGDELHNGLYILEGMMGRGVFSHVFKAKVNEANNLNVVIKIYKQNEIAGNYTAHVYL